MASRIVPFAPEHVPAVQAFNRRLAAAGAPWRFPENAVPDWLPHAGGAPVWQEYFLLLEDGIVRGANALKRQDAAVGGAHARVATFYWPISEGAINPAYALVATRLLRAAVAQEPLLFLVGIGGPETPVARLIRAFGWRIAQVPLYFKPLRPARFLRGVRYMRHRPVVGGLLNLAAATGTGWLGLKALGLALSRFSRRDRSVRTDVVEQFGDWADVIWAASASAYSFVGGRNAATLNATYPPHRPTFGRLRVSRGATTIGWAVIEDVPAPTEHFGDLRVGAIVDSLALPEHAKAVTRAAAEALADRGMDVIVANQSHPAWRRALAAAGFLPGPASWGFAASPALARLIDAADPEGQGLHLNRGDGDGPWGMLLDSAPAARSRAAG
ncbi:MAG TPA: hypothetical protein VGJ83_03340 [Gemmatimonadales bacterium]|jgi:hypothetical protein